MRQEYDGKEQHFDDGRLHSDIGAFNHRITSIVSKCFNDPDHEVQMQGITIMNQIKGLHDSCQLYFEMYKQKQKNQQMEIESISSKKNMQTSNSSTKKNTQKKNHKEQQWIQDIRSNFYKIWIELNHLPSTIFIQNIIKNALDKLESQQELQQNLDQKKLVQSFRKGLYNQLKKKNPNDYISQLDNRLCERAINKNGIDVLTFYDKFNVVKEIIVQELNKQIDKNNVTICYDVKNDIQNLDDSSDSDNDIV